MTIRLLAESILKFGRVEGLLAQLIKADSEIPNLPLGSSQKVTWVLPQPPETRFQTPASPELKLLSSIANIEVLAVYMYWDTINSFDAPLEFYQSLSQIAIEECSHLQMLICRIQDLGFDFPFMRCENSLQELSDKTEKNVIARLIVTSLYSEGKALDNKERLIEKFKRLNKDGISANLLEKIINDEIGHLRNGVKWFRYFCEKEQVDPTQKYWEVIQSLGLKHKKPFNEELRRLAHIPKDWYQQNS